MKLPLLTLLFLFIFGIDVSATSVITLDESSGSFRLDGLVEILEDKENHWTFDDIQTQELDEQFQPYHGVVPNFSYTSSVYWVKFQLTNDSNENDWLLEIDNPTLDNVTLYSSESNLNFSRELTGDLLPFDMRDMDHRNFIFNLDLEPNHEKLIYLRFETQGAMQFPLTVYSPPSFLDKSELEYGILGMFVGLGVVMAFYNLFLFFSLRNKSYLYYVIFIVANVFTHLAFTGLAYQHIWSDAVWWNNRSIVFFMSTSNIIAILFAKSFLEVKQNIPRLNRLLNVLVLFTVTVIIILMVSYPTALNLSIVGIAITSIVIIAGAYMCLKKGFRPARYFLLAWIIFFGGVVISILADSGFIPVNFYTKYAWQLSSSLELILLSFALADKINTMRLEKEQAKKNAIKSQKEMLESLQRNDKLKDKFLAVTSHELRTPLNGIIGITASLQEGAAGDINDAMNSNLSMIKRSGTRLSHLIDDILDFSKLENNNLDLSLKKVHLKEITDVVLTICETLVRQKDIQLQNNIHSKIPAILADENRLQQILYNLIGNAIKYTEKGKVTIQAKEVNAKVIIEVIDTGIGIPKEYHESIFLPFNRGGNFTNNSYQGTGIGLNITKRLVELQQGEISLESTTGKGSIFRFTLPTFKESSNVNSEIVSIEGSFSKERKEEPFREVHHVSFMNDGEKVLIADDEPVNIQILVNYLSLEGYNIQVVSDGEAVIQLIDQGAEFDMVMLDVMMPKLSGFEVCRLLRKQYSLTELPILMLTAKNQIEDRITAFELGANDYLTKPVDKRELLSRTRTLINLRKSSIEAKERAQELDLLNQELIQMNDHLEEEVSSRTKELEFKNEELDMRNMELIRVEKSRVALLSNISHELGTPLTFLQGYIQTVQEGYVNINDPKYLVLAQEKIKLLDRLIADIYDLSKFESGKMQLSMSPANAKEWFFCIYEKFEFEVKQSGLVMEKPFLKTSSDDERETLFIDIERMDQVLANLIYNAIKHTPKGGGISLSGELILYSESEDTRDFTPHMIVEVRDTGNGIPEEEIPHIFNRFFKGSSQNISGAKGSGLGLAITKEIIDYHKGEIWVESTNKQGTSLFFSLPVVLS